MGLTALNRVACVQADRMTHFTEQGIKTKRPEKLSLFGKVAILFGGVQIPKNPNLKTPGHGGYKYQNKTSRYDEKLNIPLWRVPVAGVSREPGRCAFFTFHGYSGKKENQIPMIQLAHKLKCDAFLVDLPGHGDSNVNWTTLGYREADVIRFLFEKYRAQYKNQIILYGVSMGAVSVLNALAFYNIKPRAAILEMPYGSLYGTIQRRFELMGFPVSFPFAELLLFWGGVQGGFNPLKLNSIENAKQVQTPSLVLGGEKDYRAPPEDLREIYKNLSGPKALHIFKGREHQHLYRADPAEYLAVVKKFLSEHK